MRLLRTIAAVLALSASQAFAQNVLDPFGVDAPTSGDMRRANKQVADAVLELSRQLSHLDDTLAMGFWVLAIALLVSATLIGAAIVKRR